LLAAFLLHDAPLPAAWLSRITASARDVDALAAAGLIEESADGSWSLPPSVNRRDQLRILPWSVRQSAHHTLATLCAEAGLHAARARHLTALGDTSSARLAWADTVTASVADARFDDALTALDTLAPLAVSAKNLQPFLDALRLCADAPPLAAGIETRLTAWLAQPAWRDRPAFTATASLLLATFNASAGRHTASAAFRTQAAAALRATGDLAGAARQLTAALITYLYAMHYTVARETGLQAIAAAEASNDLACQAEAHSMVGLLLGMQGDTVGGRARLEHALDLSLRHNLTASAAEAYRLLGTVAEYASCYGDQQTAFARALAYCRRHDATATAEVCMGCLSYSLFRSGNWTRARRIARGVLTGPGDIAHCVAHGVLGLCHAHRGELRDAVPHLEACRALALRLGILSIEFFYQWGIALVEQQAGRPDSAAIHYRRLLDFWCGTEDRHDAIPGLTFGALFFCDQDDLRAARDFAAALRIITTATANPEAAGAHALVSGELLRREGKPAKALPLLRQALESYARRELVVERIHTLPRLAAAFRATGDTSGADTAQREATQRAGRLGMRALLPIFETSSSTASAPTDAWSVLSPRQRDVARQLVTGATNKEIAARLGLGVRTIDMHVSHVLARLDCRSRSEAATCITSLLA
jgi:DNA-binding CsgD family transcriptional regulator/tetratricopeptide (TPR) repeat protein